LEVELRVQVLGPVRAWRDGTELDLGTPRQRALLGLLALACGQPVGRDELIDTLWSDQPPPTAINVIQTHVKRLRQIMDPQRPPHRPSVVLPRVGDGYALRLAAEAIDVERFRQLVTAARVRHHGNEGQAAAVLDEALRLWQGAPFADVPALAAHPKLAALLAERRVALARYGEALIASGAAVDALPALEEAAAAQPLDEAAQARLVRAYHAAGQPARAFETYHKVRKRLADELGVDPGAQLTAAHLALLGAGTPAPEPAARAVLPAEAAVPAVLPAEAAVPAVLPAEAAAAGQPPPPVTPEVTPSEPVPVPQPAPAPIPTQLPADVYGFTGRAAELSSLDTLLEPWSQTGDGTPNGSHQSQTSDAGLTAAVICAVSGTAGVGKTALVVHWAQRVRQHFPDGQLYLDLRGDDSDEPVSPGDALARLLTALGVRAEEIPLDVDGRTARYRTEVTGRRMLVVLDNAASVEQVRPLLPGTSSCVVVVTSRDRLAGLVALHGARRLNVGLLPMKDALSLVRTLIGSPVLAEPAAAAELVEQCARLPLALRVAAELAVTRPQTLLAELVAELADHKARLEFLDVGGDARGAVRTVFSWSYQRLPDDVAQAFRWLGLYPGPDADLYAIAALCGTDLGTARRLAAQLTRVHLVQVAGTGRLSLHDLLSAYAAELSHREDTEAERRAALTRLFDYYLVAGAAAVKLLHPADQQHHPPRATPDPITPRLRDPAAARAWLDAERPTLVALCAHGAAHGFTGQVSRLAATLYRYLEGGHHIDALTIHTHALAGAQRAGDLAGQADALTCLGAVYRVLGRYIEATEQLTRAITLYRGTADRRGEARALSNLGVVDERLGHNESATRHHKSALALYRRAGDRYGEASTLNNLGAVYSLGQYAAAAEHYQEAIALYRSLGERVGEAIALSNLGIVNASLAQYQLALDRFQQALTIFQELGHRYGEASALNNLGDVNTRLGRYRVALDHQQRSLALFRELGQRYGEAGALNGLGEALLGAGRPQDALERHLAAMTIAVETGDRDEKARAHHGAGRGHRDTGDVARARQQWREALDLYTGLGAPEAESVRADLDGLNGSAPAGA
jgi:DNA-binding SARP family transcriptional activator/Tfp pilus assembly protein PilF